MLDFYRTTELLESQPVSGNCFFHVGTHKTGTSSLKTIIQPNDQCLERNGIFVPESGRTLPRGLDNLAWGLMGRLALLSAFGSWDDFLAELRSHDPPAIC